RFAGYRAPAARRGGTTRMNDRVCRVELTPQTGTENDGSHGCQVTRPRLPSHGRTSVGEPGISGAGTATEMLPVGVLGEFWAAARDALPKSTTVNTTAAVMRNMVASRVGWMEYSPGPTPTWRGSCHSGVVWPVARRPILHTALEGSSRR